MPSLQFIRQPTTESQRQHLLDLGFLHMQIPEKMSRFQTARFITYLERKIEAHPEKKEELFESFAPPLIPEDKDVYFVDGAEVKSVSFSGNGCYCVIKNGEVIVDKLLNNLFNYELEFTAVYEAFKQVNKTKKPSVIFSDCKIIVKALNLNWVLINPSLQRVHDKINYMWNHGNRNRATIKLVDRWQNPAKEYLRKKYKVRWRDLRLEKL